MFRSLKKLFVIFFVCSSCMIGLVGCKADISAYGDEKILVTGLTEEEFYITPNELAGLSCISATAQGNSAKAGTVRAYGPTLETFVQEYGMTLEEFESVKFSATDNYEITLAALTWEKYDVILSIANGSEALEERQQPLRIVVPGANSGKWIRLVTEIHFTKAEE